MQCKHAPTRRSFNKAGLVVTGNGQLSSSTQAHSKGINAVSILPSGQGNLALSAAKDHTVRLWSAPALQATSSGEAQEGAVCLAVYKGHTDAVEDVAASPSGGAFCSGAWDGNVHVWRTGATPISQVQAVALGNKWIFVCVCVAV